MTLRSTRSILVAAALLLAGSSLAQPAEPPVSIRTEGLPAHVAARLEAKAREGMTALVQYVHRTRMMGHQVNVAELLADDPAEGRKPARRAPRRAR